MPSQAAGDWDGSADQCINANWAADQCWHTLGAGSCTVDSGHGQGERGSALCQCRTSDHSTHSTHCAWLCHVQRQARVKAWGESGQVLALCCGPVAEQGECSRLLQQEGHSLAHAGSCIAESDLGKGQQVLPGGSAGAQITAPSVTCALLCHVNHVCVCVGGGGARQGVDHMLEVLGESISGPSTPRTRVVMGPAAVVGAWAGILQETLVSMWLMWALVLCCAYLPKHCTCDLMLHCLPRCCAFLASTDHFSLSDMLHTCLQRKLLCEG